MSKPYKSRNKRIIQRGGGGRFRKTTLSDIGIAGVCDKCGSFMAEHYNGDLKEQHLDPRRFIKRCFTCNPIIDKDVNKSTPEIIGKVGGLRVNGDSNE